MRRSAVALLFALLTPAIISAQSDSTPAVPASTTSPTFHAGQWGARFEIGNGFSSIGALHFSTPTKAWTLSARIGASYSDYSGSSNRGNLENLSLSVGRRWFRTGTGRIRPFTGLGVSTGVGRSHSRLGANTQTNLSYSLGGFGEIGATIFFAPELSLGASWTGGASIGQGRYYQNGSQVDHYTSVSASGGEISLEGAFYF